MPRCCWRARKQAAKSGIEAVIFPVTDLSYPFKEEWTENAINFQKYVDGHAPVPHGILQLIASSCMYLSGCSLHPMRLFLCVHAHMYTGMHTHSNTYFVNLYTHLVYSSLLPSSYTQRVLSKYLSNDWKHLCLMSARLCHDPLEKPQDGSRGIWHWVSSLRILRELRHRWKQEPVGIFLESTKGG